MAELELLDSLVDVKWLQARLGHARLVLFDASWHMPSSGRDGYSEWRERHIPGARFFDFDHRICAPPGDLPHMLPDAETFTREVRSLGLNRDSVAIVYDSLGMFSAPRAWWMLRAMGFDRCALLDGGLPAWQAAGYPLESAQQATDPAPGDFVAKLNPALVADARAVLAALEDQTRPVLDARPRERFLGEAAEPRPGLRRGHMPGAHNLPFTELFEADGRLRSKTELRERLEPLLRGRVGGICSCGSGVTACVLAFAAHYCGAGDLAVYDGSWCEWGQPGELPVVSG